MPNPNPVAETSEETRAIARAEARKRLKRFCQDLRYQHDNTTLAQMAETAGVSISTATNAENARNVTLAKMRSLYLEALGCSIEEFEKVAIHWLLTQSGAEELTEGIWDRWRQRKATEGRDISRQEAKLLEAFSNLTPSTKRTMITLMENIGQKEYLPVLRMLETIGD